MKLYVTDNGTWGGTKAEMPALCREDGSGLGGWREATVPTDKKNLLDFLNHRKVGASAAPVPKVRERAPPPPATGSGRYRVYGGFTEKRMVAVASADSPEEACANVAATLKAV